MFDTFPATALMTLHAGVDDVEGFSRRHPDITVERVIGPLPILVLSVPTRETMLGLLRDIGVRHVEPDRELIPQTIPACRWSDDQSASGRCIGDCSSCEGI